MTDLLAEARRLLRDQQDVAEREISVPLRISEALEQSEQIKSLSRRMNTPDPASTLLPTMQAATPHELRNYSLQRLFSCMAKDPTGKRESCLERELSQSLREDLKRVITVDHSGVLVPLQLSPRMDSGLDTRTGARGGYTIANRVEDIVTYLRSKSVVLRLGGTLLSGLSSQVSIPLQTSGSTATWASENPGADVAESDSRFGNISLQPRTLTCTTSYSRGLLGQSSADVEAFLRSYLASAHATALDAAAFTGKGNSGQPIGLLNEGNVPVVAIGADGGSPTGAILADMERVVGDASADLGMLGWATTPTMRYRLRQVPLFTNSSLPCWQGDEGQDQCLGFPAVVSKSIPQTLVKGNSSDCNLIVVGYWPALAFASWGVLEILADPYTKKKTGEIEITSHQLCDVVIRRTNAFCLCVDARNV